MKRLICIVLALVMLLSMAPMAGAADASGDVSGGNENNAQLWLRDCYENPSWFSSLNTTEDWADHFTFHESKNGAQLAMTDYSFRTNDSLNVTVTKDADADTYCIEVKGTGEGDLFVTANGTQYILHVTAVKDTNTPGDDGDGDGSYADVGFFSDSAGNSPIESFAVTAVGDSFYIICGEGWYFDSVTLDGDFDAIADVNAVDSCTDCWKITFTTAPENRWYYLSYIAKDSAGNSYSESYGLELKDTMPGLKYRGLDWSETGFVENKNNPLESVVNFPLNANNFVKFYFCDGATELEIDPAELVCTGSASVVKVEGEEYSELSGCKCGEGTISYERDGKTYTIPVSIFLPSFGFYSSQTLSEESFLTEVKVTEDNQAIYFLANENCSITDVGLLSNFEAIAAVEKVSDTCWKITVTGRAENRYYEISYSGNDNGREFSGWGNGINIFDAKPGLKYRGLDWTPTGFVENKNNLLESVVNFPLNASNYVKFYFYDGTTESEIDPSDLVCTGSASVVKVEGEEYSELSGCKCGEGTISYTTGEKTYSIPVEIDQPQFGFYSSSDISAKTCIKEFNFIETGTAFYFAAINGGEITELTTANPFDSDFPDMFAIEKISSALWKITINDDPMGWDCRFNYSGSDGDGDTFSDRGCVISLKKTTPAFGFRRTNDSGVLVSSWVATPGAEEAVNFVWFDGSEDTDFSLRQITIPSFLEASEENGVITLKARTEGSGVISCVDNGVTRSMPVDIKEASTDNTPASQYAAYIDDYAIGIAWRDEETGILSINEGGWRIGNGMTGSKQDKYDHMRTNEIAVGVKKYDEQNNVYYEVVNDNKVSVKLLDVWVETIEGSEAGISLSSGNLDMAKNSYTSNSFDVYLRYGYPSTARIYANVEVTTGKETQTVTVSSVYFTYNVTVINENRPNDDTVEKLNQRLEELAKEYTVGDVYNLELNLAPIVYEGTIIIPEEFFVDIENSADLNIWGSSDPTGNATVLKGAVNLNGATISSINNICLQATEECKTGVYGGSMLNMMFCSFRNYDVAIDGRGGMMTLTRNNVFVNNDVAVLLDVASCTGGMNRNSWNGNTFLNNGTAVQINSLNEFISAYYLRIVDSNFINNKTDFDVRCPATLYMYRNYYGDIHNQSKDLSMPDVLQILMQINTEEEIRGQQLISSNSPNIEIAKGTKAKVITNPRWKYPVLYVWNANMGFAQAAILSTVEDEEDYENILISDWSLETQIVNNEAGTLIIDGEAFDSEEEKVIDVVDPNENPIGSWSFD